MDTGSSPAERTVTVSVTPVAATFGRMRHGLFGYWPGPPESRCAWAPASRVMRGPRRRGAGRPARRTARRATSRGSPSDDPDGPEPGPAGRLLLLLVDERLGRVSLRMLRTLRAVVA
jgi:hypothetical protein